MSNIKLSDSPNVSEAFVEKDGKILRATLQETPAGTLELSDSPNVDTGYIIDGDGKKHKVHLVAEPTGTLETPESETSDKGYIIDGDGKKHRVSLVANVSGGGSTINNQDITITANGTYTADEGYTGIGTATVNVSGGGSKYGATIEIFLGDVDANGVLQNPSSPVNITFNGVKNIAAATTTSSVLFRRFQNLGSVGEVSFPDLINNVRPGSNIPILANAFYSTSIKKLLCPKVVYCKKQDFYYVCYSCKDLEEINFDEVSSMNYEDQVFAYAFYGCEKLKTASFKSLLTISGNNVFQYAFANSGIENLYFYLSKNGNLTSNVFSNMLNGVNGCTIHFPANLNGATKISSLSGYPNFGGTNTVLAYDLPNIMRLNNLYIRHPAGDTDTASCWGTGVYPMTLVYTLGKTDPVIGDNIYSDSACTIVAYTVSSITEV